jgi:eukaryotic-like serine/threonine-protein kinase
MCRYIPSGILIYRQANSLMAAPFDPVKVEITGPAVAVAEGVRPHQYNISASGSLVYVPGGDTAETVLTMTDRSGASQPLPTGARSYDEMRVSPDGHRLALTIGEDVGNVWVYDVDRQTFTRLTYDGAQTPIWSQDGEKVTYVSRRNGTRKVYSKSADGSGTEQEIMKGEVDPVSWSPDGKCLIFNELSVISRSNDIWMYCVEKKTAAPLIQSPFNEVGGYYSPNGRFIAYSSEESGQSEIYVQAMTAGQGRWQISADGGELPRWSHDGSEIFYVEGNALMSVPVKTEPGFSSGKPKKLFETEFNDYAVAADNQHFILLQEKNKETATRQINLVFNWAEELKRRIRSGGKPD